MPVVFEKNGYEIDTDAKRLDLDVIHRFLAFESYWALGRSKEQIKQAIQHSLCFGVYDPQGNQVGFARVITDWTVFAYLCDVFIVGSERGKGLGKDLIDQVVKHEALKGIRSILLTTDDAHGLYQAYGGFKPLKKPENWLLRRIEAETE